MFKLIGGSLSFSFGLLLTFTGIGALIGIPMMIGGLGAAAIGFGQLGFGAAKAGTKLGKVYRDSRREQEDRTELADLRGEQLRAERAELEELRAEKARRLEDERNAY